MQKHAKICINMQKYIERVKMCNNSKKIKKITKRQKLPKTDKNWQKQEKIGNIRQKYVKKVKNQKWPKTGKNREKLAIRVKNR